MIDITIEEEYFKVDSDQTRPKVRFKHKPCRSIDDKAELLSVLDFEIEKVRQKNMAVFRKTEKLREKIDKLGKTMEVLDSVHKQMNDKRDKVYSTTPDGAVMKIESHIDRLQSQKARCYMKLSNITQSRRYDDNISSKVIDIETKIKAINKKIEAKQSDLEVAIGKSKVSKKVDIPCVSTSRHGENAVWDIHGGSEAVGDGYIPDILEPGDWQDPTVLQPPDESRTWF